MNAIKDGKHIKVYDAFLIKESIKQIVGSTYDGDNKVWLVPYSKDNAATLALLGAELDESLILDVTPPVAGDEVPLIPMPIKATPYQHQIRAYNFALLTYGIGGTA